MGKWFTGSEQSKSGNGSYVSFSTPFMEVGDGNLSLPNVNSRLLGVGGSIRFGADNLFPQLLNQMYYTSPLNAAIIDFKTNSVCGGGFDIVPRKENDAKLDVAIYAFISRNKIKKNLKTITRELIAHERVYFQIKMKQNFEEGKVVSVKPIAATFISSDKIRKHRSGNSYVISDDWSTALNVRTIKEYTGNCKDKYQLYVYENTSLGQDFYPIPSYSTANNWYFLDGESSYLHKTNIKESIFPSFAMMFPKKPSGQEEIEAVKDTLEGAKGAQEAGRIFTFFANKKEQLPELVPIPKNNNDTLFVQTDERGDNKICQAHVIDPILMGIRVSGKLGGGSDIKQAYIIYEKNFVIDKRDEVEEIYNELLSLFGVNATMKINNYQIINDVIVEVEKGEKDILGIISKLSPELQKIVLESLSTNERRSLGGANKIKGGDSIPTTAPQQQQPNTPSE